MLKFARLVSVENYCMNMLIAIGQDIGEVREEKKFPLSTPSSPNKIMHSPHMVGTKKTSKSAIKTTYTHSPQP